MLLIVKMIIMWHFPAQLSHWPSASSPKKPPRSGKRQLVPGGCPLASTSVLHCDMHIFTYSPYTHMHSHKVLSSHWAVFRKMVKMLFLRSAHSRSVEYSFCCF